MALWEAKGETAAPLFLAAASEVPRLVSLRTALVVAGRFLRTLPTERHVLALQAVSTWAEASQEASDAREALDGLFRFAGFVITKCQSTTAQRLMGIAEELLRASVANVPIVKTDVQIIIIIIIHLLGLAPAECLAAPDNGQGSRIAGGVQPNT
jgi:hypothetical protein